MKFSVSAWFSVLVVVFSCNGVAGYLRIPPTTRPTKAPTPAPKNPAPTPAPKTKAPTPAPKTPAPTPAPKTPAPTQPILVTRLINAIGTVQECPRAPDFILAVPSSPRRNAVAHILSAAANGVDLSTDAKLVQRYALAVYYFSTHGENWIRKDNWLSNFDPCDSSNRWFQVSCDLDSKVIGLDHNNNNLVGDMPCEVNILSRDHSSGAGSLETFIVNGNSRLRMDPIISPPGWMGGLGSGLQILFIDNTVLKAPIPAELGLRLVNLRHFSASNVFAANQDLSFLQTFSRDLLTLWLEGNNIEGTIPSFLGEFHFLDFFSVRNNRLVGTVPSELANIPSNPSIYLSHNNLTGSLDNDPALCEFRGVIEVDCNPSCQKVTCTCPPCVCPNEC